MLKSIDNSKLFHISSDFIVAKVVAIVALCTNDSSCSCNSSSGVGSYNYLSARVRLRGSHTSYKSLPSQAWLLELSRASSCFERRSCWP
jgi:hypothetical protein